MENARIPNSAVDFRSINYNLGPLCPNCWTLSIILIVEVAPRLEMKSTSYSSSIYFNRSGCGELSFCSKCIKDNN